MRDSKETKPCVSNGETGSMLLASFLKKGNKRKDNQKWKAEESKTCPNLDRKTANRTALSADVEGKAKQTRKRKKEREKGKIEPDESLRLQRRTRYLLIKMKLDQNLIDAYSTEGWKGQSREKIRPDKELERARKQIVKCKLGIRDAIRQLDLLSSIGSIEEKVIAPDGSVHHEHIFCAKCSSREAFLDNDIILCDGTCNRAFHQKCLDPPLETDSIPPGDEGWFCKLCVCKMEIIDSTNAHVGTQFPMDSNWQDIFEEEANLPNGPDTTLNHGGDWPSDDSEDDDYDPEMRGQGSSMSGLGCGDDDNDDNDDDGESISTSLSWSSDAVALSSASGKHVTDIEYKDRKLGETSNDEIVCGPRQRRAVDYKKLYDEMFGKDALLYEQVSEDEDWGPTRKRRRAKESDAENTETLCESHTNSEMAEERREKLYVDDKGGRRSIFRLPNHAIEKLRQVFAETELPSKHVRDNLSKELCLEPEKVSKWFKNARYMALKNRKTENLKQPQGSAGFSEDSETKAIKEKDTETKEPENVLIETVSHGSIDPNKVSAFVLKNNQQGFSELRGDNTSLEMVEEEERERRTAEETDVCNKELEEVMEMLCRMQNKLQNMKSRLSRFRPQRGRKKLGKSSSSSSSLLEQDSVVYVPIAEIKEKDLNATVIP